MASALVGDDRTSSPVASGVLGSKLSADLPTVNMPCINSLITRDLLAATRTDRLKDPSCLAYRCRLSLIAAAVVRFRFCGHDSPPCDSVGGVRLNNYSRSYQTDVTFARIRVTRYTQAVQCALHYAASNGRPHALATPSTMSK
jgi:hypothetical protein